MPTIKHGSSNLPWSREEIILVLHLYKQHLSKHKKGNISQIAAETYSKHLNDLAVINGTPIEEYENYRSSASIKLRVGNFIGLDESLPNNKGLDRKSKEVLKIWNEFENNFPALKTEAEDILKDIKDFQNSVTTSAKETLREIYAEEGGVRLLRHKVRERNPKIVQKKKQKVFKEKGFLSCEVCGFTFSEKYGKHGENFIECHHNKPLSEMKDSNKTYLSDLSLVCANCHRMIHKKREFLTIEELKEIIEEN